MGQEARCVARIDGRKSEGEVHLESETLVFRGEFKWKIELKQLLKVEAKNGKLELEWSGGAAVFDLGAVAEKWASQIKHPKSLLDKLGVRPESSVCTLNLEDDRFRTELAERVASVSWGKLRNESDFIFLGANRRHDLERLGSLVQWIKKDGAVWVVWPKGQERLKASDVIDAGKSAGLVDTKVASFSTTLSALKLVIPVKQRKKGEDA